MRDARRLILLGYGNFRDEHRTVHDLLVSLKIPHIYEDGPEREHVWSGGWLSEAVKCLLGGAP